MRLYSASVPLSSCPQGATARCGGVVQQHNPAPACQAQPPPPLRATFRITMSCLRPFGRSSSPCCEAIFSYWFHCRRCGTAHSAQTRKRVPEQTMSCCACCLWLHGQLLLNPSKGGEQGRQSGSMPRTLQHCQGEASEVLPRVSTSVCMRTPV